MRAKKTSVKTLAQACQFVKKVKVCTIFPSDKVEHTSLWEHVGIPDKRTGEKGWGKKMGAVWEWKNELPATFPDDVYYGKIKGGLAVLMDMQYMADVHFPQAFKPVRSLNKLTRQIFERVSEETLDTTALRKAVIHDVGCTKSQFDMALKNLQITMNIVRLNDPDAEQDMWVPFKELYLEVWRRYVEDE